MKSILSFFNKPLYVSIISIVVAIIIGFFAYRQFNPPATIQLSSASSGQIDLAGGGESSSTLEHLILSFAASGKVTKVNVKVGDAISKDEILATLDPGATLGAVTEAEAAYETAEANYNKVVNGATETTINQSNVSVQTAENNLITAVQNAYTQTYNLVRTDLDKYFNGPTFNSPQFQISFFDSSSNSTVVLHPNDINESLKINNERFDLNSLLVNWHADISATSSFDLDSQANHTIQYLSAVKNLVSDMADVTNSLYLNATKYQTNLDAAKSDLATAKTTLDNLSSNIQSDQLALQSAKASAAVTTAAARPEDVAAAKASVDSALGALQIAKAAFNNTVIKSPGVGTITAVYINAGETAMANAPAIEVSGEGFTKDVAVMVPNNALTNEGGQYYVMVKTSAGIVKRAVTIGASDRINTEIVSGLTAGEQVVLH